MENLTAFSLFAIVASITPGPTNFIILNLSSRYKISKTFPVILGSCIGAATCAHRWHWIGFNPSGLPNYSKNNDTHWFNLANLVGLEII